MRAIEEDVADRRRESKGRTVAASRETVIACSRSRVPK
jgi:hypothetical protein